MPKRLKISPNERIDKEDFDRASNDYTTEQSNFNYSQAWLDPSSRILAGFRVEIADQTASPGLVSVHNGVALDREGNVLNDEDQINASQSISLVGASQTFYLEVEFITVDSDTDARAFWDPTIDNGGAPIPDGGEVSVNVATRLTPTWQIVTPVSTSGFDVDSNPNSTKIPLAKLSTDVSNEITAAVNTALTQVPPASVLVQDAAATDTTVKVINSRIFPDTGTILVDFGSGSSESVTLTSNDRDNNVLTFTPALASSHTTGAIVRESTTGRFVQENDDPNNANLTTASPGHTVDRTKKFWQGDENRGAAFIQDKETFGGRNDLDVETLKDHVDYLAGMVRELKFGHPRKDVTSNAPPASFSSEPRHFDYAGSVQGARSVSITIGDGSSTYGDFNGTDETPFASAVTAIASLGGEGTVVVKAGTYTFANPVVISAGTDIKFLGEGSVTLASDTAGVFSIGSNAIVRFEKLVLQDGSAAPFDISAADAASVYITQCSLTNTQVTSSDAAETVNLYVDDCTNTELTIQGVGVSGTPLFPVLTGWIRDCKASSSSAQLIIDSVSLSDFSIDNCTFLGSTVFNLDNASALGFPNKFRVTNCEFDVTAGLAGAAPISVAAGSTTDHIIFSNCRFRTTGLVSPAAATYTVELSPGGGPEAIIFDSCVFEPNSLVSSFPHYYISTDIPAESLVISDTVSVGSSAAQTFLSRVDDAVTKVNISNCSGTSGIIEYNGNADFSGSVTVSGCSFSIPNSYSLDFDFITTTTTTESSFFIENNKFNGNYAATSTVNVSCVDLATSSGFHQIMNNTFEDFETSGNLTVVQSTIANSVGEYLHSNICNNVVQRASCAGTFLGVFVDAGGTTVPSGSAGFDGTRRVSRQVKVHGNTLKNLELTTVSTGIIGVVSAPEETIVSENVVTAVNLASGTSCIIVDTESEASYISGNIVRHIVLDSGSGANDLVGLSASTSGANLTNAAVTGNVVDALSITTASQTGEIRGVRLFGNSVSLVKCAVSNNIVSSLQRTAGSGSVYGIDLNSSGATITNCIVTDNIIEDFDSDSAGSGDVVRGVSLRANSFDQNSIIGNNINGLNSTTNVFVTGILVNSAGLFTTVANNTVRAVGNVARPGDCYGILLLSGQLNCSVSNNTVSNVRSADTANGIDFGVSTSNGLVSVVGNVIDSLNSQVAGGASYGIRIFGDKLNISNNTIDAIDSDDPIGILFDGDFISISGNVLNNVEDSASSLGLGAIKSTAGSSNLSIISNVITNYSGGGIKIDSSGAERNIKIHNNTLDSNNGAFAIWVNPGGQFTNVSVNGNTVFLNDGAMTGTGSAADGFISFKDISFSSRLISVCGNSVTRVSGGAGILTDHLINIAGSLGNLLTSVSVNDNVLDENTVSHTSNAISCDYIDKFTVSGNCVDFSGNFSIYVNNSEVGAVNSNTINPGGSIEIGVDNSSEVIISGNIVDDGSATGSIIFATSTNVKAGTAALSSASSRNLNKDV